MTTNDYPIKKKFNGYWYLCAIPIGIGLLLILLVLSGIISDKIGVNGILVENGFRTFALGCMLIMIGFSLIGIVVIIKKLYSKFIKKPW